MGGVASLAGSVIGGILIVLVLELVREFKFSIEIVFGASLLAFVLFQPAGLVELLRRIGPGWRERLHYAGAGAEASPPKLVGPAP
jgi:ABC-type branched-subunit amino acid transport system permease subunit